MPLAAVFYQRFIIVVGVFKDVFFFFDLFFLPSPEEPSEWLEGPVLVDEEPEGRAFVLLRLLL